MPSIQRSRLRRIAEEEFVVILLLAAFAAIFLLIFPPSLLVNDSWLTLVSGGRSCITGSHTTTR